MDWLADPEFFGCGNKVGYFDTLPLAALGGDSTKGDYSEFIGFERGALSIDKVYQCSKDPAVFAAISLNHVLNDVLVSSASPVQVGIAFDFASDLDLRSRSELVSAFSSELSRRKIQLGKCHSSLSDLTSVTIAVVAANPVCEALAPTQGDVVLSRAIGHFKMHYLHETGQIDVANASTPLIVSPFSPLSLRDKFSDVADVSGHGIAGSLHSLALRNSIDIEVVLSPNIAAHPLVLELPNPCLLNDYSAFQVEGLEIEIDSWRLAGLSETAGPLVGLINRESVSQRGEGGWPKTIGHFRPGDGKLTIKWIE